MFHKLGTLYQLSGCASFNARMEKALVIHAASGLCLSAPEVYEAKFFEQDIQGARKAAEFVRDFNHYLYRQGEAACMIYMNMPEVWTGTSGTLTGKKGLVEPYIAGRYQKFNSNSGWSNDDHPLMAALSHYSWYASKGKYVLCDLQGSGDEDHYLLTDPAVLSTTAELLVQQCFRRFLFLRHMSHVRLQCSRHSASSRSCKDS